MKLLIIPKEACNATEGLSQSTVICCNLQYIIISYLEEYFSAYLHGGTLYKILQNFRFMLMQKDLDLMRSASVHEFKNVSLFKAIFATIFNVIFKDHIFCSHIFKQTCT